MFGISSAIFSIYDKCKLKSKVMASVEKLLAKYDPMFVKLPGYMETIILDETLVKDKPHTATPSHVREIMKKNENYKYMEYGARLNILHYILSDKRYQDVVGLEVIPVNKAGEFRTLSHRTTSVLTPGSLQYTDLYLCNEDQETLFPGLNGQLITRSKFLGFVDDFGGFS